MAKTVSMSAAMASRPLLPFLPPARSLACWTVLVVRRPKAMGTPVWRVMWVRPWATAWAMYWSWGVSPLMTQPRARMPANLAERAAWRQSAGSSKEPGALMMARWSGEPPAEAYSRVAAWRRRSVMEALYRLTTMASGKRAVLEGLDFGMGVDGRGGGGGLR